ncbi:MAG: hypothetical protein ACP5R4_03240 [Armatimonadota bacterium]
MCKLPLTTKEVGRIGGNTTKAKYGREHFVEMGRRAARVLMERYGSDHYRMMAQVRHEKRLRSEDSQESAAVTASEAGRKGGTTVKEKYGRDHFVAAGQRGGSATREKYGSEHYACIGRLGGMSKARRRSDGFNSGGSEKRDF